MKKILLLAVLLFTAIAYAQDPAAVLNKDHKVDSSKVILPDSFYERQTQMITKLLSVNHYKKMPLTDSISSAVFDEYIKSLDFTKSYFLKEDIDSFEKYRFHFDEYLDSGKLDAPFEIFNVFKKRVSERIEYVKNLLKKEFDFTVKEVIQLDREKSSWAKTVDEVNELWRLRLKNDALIIVLGGKDWKKASSDLLKRYQNFHKLVLQYETEDVFAIFMNSFTQAFDPHTDYFSPAISENFNINMRLSLEGIGATLRQDGDYTTVANIVPGGPAAKSNLIHEDDRIIAVAQGEEGEFVDIIGWRLDDAIQLIRGKKGTMVRLQILEKEEGDNAIPKEIRIIREKVKLEEQAAKGETLNFEQEGKNFKIGVVKLPSFYIDFESMRQGKIDYRSTTRDVKDLISKFKDEKVDGVVIDLRGNGGGSLQEAIEMTGLFIKEGPVVQVKAPNNQIEVDRDPDPSIFYDGPLAVMVDRQSASASEIFAAAIQDYGRGLILGDNTYGKGTVQNIYDLNQVRLVSNRKFGQLKMTIAKFYRINGSSTQRKGVLPDIKFPSPFELDEFGENSYTTALQWDQIRTSDYIPVNEINKWIPLLQKKHESRVKNDVEYQILSDEFNEMKKARQQKEFSLNIDDRKAQREEAEARRKKRDEERAKLLGIKIEKKGEVSTSTTNQSDYQLKETGRILADLILSKVG